tara:strand:+ start:2257 stop:2475 length:219 start_codon:yes stop_codon:yes gene_type:complete
VVIIDAREMKKHILVTALVDHLHWMEDADIDAKYYQVAMTLDLEGSEEPSEAQYQRYMRVLRDMANNAQSKI